MSRATLVTITCYGALALTLIGSGFAQDSADTQPKAASEAEKLAPEKLDETIKVDIDIEGATIDEKSQDKSWLEAAARAVIQAMTKDEKTKTDFTASSKQAPRKYHGHIEKDADGSYLVVLEKQ